MTVAVSLAADLLQEPACQQKIANAIPQIALGGGALLTLIGFVHAWEKSKQPQQAPPHDPGA